MAIPQPVLKPLKDNQYLLVKDLKCDTVTIPKGFVTDGASIPRFFWRLLGSNMDTDRIWQAIRHDFRYRVQTITRKESDKEFLDSLDGFSRYFVYAAVRSCGWAMWNRHAKTIKDNLACEESEIKKEGLRCHSDKCCGKSKCCWRARMQKQGEQK